MVRVTFCHRREVRRFKTITGETEEEVERSFEDFVNSPSADDDGLWDNVEDNDGGESEVREAEVLDLHCRTCGDLVAASELRAHLVTHHPGAWSLDLEQVRDCYEAAP